MQRAILEKLASAAPARRGSRLDEPGAYPAAGILYLGSEARFDYRLNLPEAADVDAKINPAMRAIEKHNGQFPGGFSSQQCVCEGCRSTLEP